VKLVTDVSERSEAKRVSAANEPRERSEPAKRLASEGVGESERRSPSEYEGQ